MNMSCPRNRKKFNHKWDELDYLCEKIFYHIYVGRSKSSANRFASRAEVLLSDIDEDCGAILYYTANALLSELSGNIKESAKYRILEIEKTIELYSCFTESDDKEVVEFALQGREQEMQLNRLKLVCSYYEEYNKESSLLLIDIIGKFKAAEYPLK